MAAKDTRFLAHEFHYAREIIRGDIPALFSASDALGAELGGFGAIEVSAFGSFIHLIDQAD